MNMAKKTSLYETHLKYGGKMVDFAGWLLPIQYESTGVIAEHLAVRQKCGLFDVSHMGEFLLEGQTACKNLNHLMTNDFTTMPVGRARYSPLCNENGGVVDDLIVYKFSDVRYFIVVNAANTEKDYAWLKKHLLPGSELTDVSSSYSQIALQGPASRKILETLASSDLIPEKYYTCVENGTVAGLSCIISKTGYTGEDGFEFYLPNNSAVQLWEALMKAGSSYGLIPCGLGARDTLRLEAAMPLYGHEMDDTVSPLEAGLGFAVKTDKADFIGKSALGLPGRQTRIRVGLEATGRGILREKMPVFADDGKTQLGMTTSGTFAPYLKKSVALALLSAGEGVLGRDVVVYARGRAVEARIVPLPFYKKTTARTKGI
jgi:aminomethyltransferase